MKMKNEFAFNYKLRVRNQKFVTTGSGLASLTESDRQLNRPEASLVSICMTFSLGGESRLVEHTGTCTDYLFTSGQWRPLVKRSLLLTRSAVGQL